MRRKGLFSSGALLACMLAVADPSAAAPTEQHGPVVSAYPLDFAQTLELQAARKFTANDVRSFVYRVFAMYERGTSETRHVGPQAFRPFVDDNVRVDFPDYQIHNWDEFVAWHQWIHAQLVGDDHVLGPIDVAFLTDGRYQVHFVVVWRALFKNGDFKEARIEQTWGLREQPDRDLPVIETYIAKLADFRLKE